MHFSTRKLELKHWRAKPDSPSSSQYLPQMSSLNKRKRNSPYATLRKGELNIRWQHFIFILLYVLFSFVKKIVKCCIYVGQLDIVLEHISSNYVV